MTEFAQKALLLLIGAAATGLITGIGFLIKRRFGREDPIDRFITQHERLLATPISSLQQVSQQDRERLQDFVRDLHPGVGFQEELYKQSNSISQAEIGMRAAQEADAAMLKVSQMVERLAYRLNNEQRAVLRESQTAWERHVDLQARIAADAFAGGTIMPTIFHVERATLAGERAIALKRLLDSYLD